MSSVLIYVLKHMIILPNVISMTHFPLNLQLPLFPCTGVYKLDQPSLHSNTDNV